MKGKLCLFCVCLCVLLCSCQGTVLENQSKEEITFLEQYNEIFRRENAKRAALIYLDEDAIPELLLVKNGAYQLYSFGVFKTSGTGDVGSVAEIKETRVIARTDLTHAGRNIYRIMQYDSCCCIIDWFTLSAGFEGGSYAAEDEFYYRGREISMEEFEAIRDMIVFVDSGAKQEVTVYW